VLTQLLVDLTPWTKHQKKTIVNPISSKTKVDNCYSRLILDILFRKGFPLSEVLSPRTTTLKELVSPTNQKH
jgi:hypothetical protein